MQATPIMIPDHDTDDRRPTYLARIWTAPPPLNDAWIANDSILTDVETVEEALDWISTRPARDGFELFVRVDDREPWIRIAGRPADGVETTVEIPLAREDDAPLA